MKIRSHIRRLVSLPALALIRAYQWFISPWLGPHCRYSPTCSEFAFQAIARHGVVAGLWLSSRRILRCHPFGGHGFDPVPEQPWGGKRDRR